MSNIPENLNYTAEHEWIKIEGETGTAGITDFAQGELGDIVFVELPSIGKHVQAGKTFGTIEAIKAVSDLYAPVSGEIVEVNKVLAETPEMINSDPYGEGWIVKIKLSNVSELSNLLSAQKYSELINN
ncbi:glycine cleavage system protein GcvH [bacterium]|nr:glycine cleavage system protein GcvH [bacterium]